VVACSAVASSLVLRSPHLVTHLASVTEAVDETDLENLEPALLKVSGTLRTAPLSVFCSVLVCRELAEGGGGLGHCGEWAFADLDELRTCLVEAAVWRNGCDTYDHLQDGGGGCLRRGDFRLYNVLLADLAELLKAAAGDVADACRVPEPLAAPFRRTCVVAASHVAERSAHHVHGRGAWPVVACIVYAVARGMLAGGVARGPPLADVVDAVSVLAPTLPRSWDARVEVAFRVEDHRRIVRYGPLKEFYERFLSEEGVAIKAIVERAPGRWEGARSGYAAVAGGQGGAPPQLPGAPREPPLPPAAGPAPPQGKKKAVSFQLSKDVARGSSRSPLRQLQKMR